MTVSLKSLWILKDEVDSIESVIKWYSDGCGKNLFWVDCVVELTNASRDKFCMLLELRPKFIFAYRKFCLLIENSEIVYCWLLQFLYELKFKIPWTRPIPAAQPSEKVRSTWQSKKEPPTSEDTRVTAQHPDQKRWGNIANVKNTKNGLRRTNQCKRKWTNVNVNKK